MKRCERKTQIANLYATEPIFLSVHSHGAGRLTKEVLNLILIQVQIQILINSGNGNSSLLILVLF